MAVAPNIATTALNSTPRPDGAVRVRSDSAVHHALAETLTMCSRGDSAELMTARLRRSGLSEREAVRARLAIERQVRVTSQQFRRSRLRALMLIAAQLVLAVVMLALHLAASPWISIALLGALLYRAWNRLHSPQSAGSTLALLG